MEQDSGIVTAGMIDARSSAVVTEEDARTDLYKPAKSVKEVTELLEKGVEEFNKIHPRIKLALYKVSACACFWVCFRWLMWCVCMWRGDLCGGVGGV